MRPHPPRPAVGRIDESSSWLAVLDWGIGGFGFVSEYHRRVGSLPYLYVSDSGSPPYGTLPRRALSLRLEQIGQYVTTRGARVLVVACNAASSALPYARMPVGLLVLDVISSGLRYVSRSAKAGVRLGVVGGARTIRSQCWARALSAKGFTVRQRIAQPLSAHVERGDLDSAIVARDIARIVSPLRAMDGLVLACTHYPALMPLFRRELAGQLMLDPVVGLVDDAARSMGRRGRSASVEIGVEVHTTGDPESTKRFAAAAFGVAVPEVRRLTL